MTMKLGETTKAFIALSIVALFFCNIAMLVHFTKEREIFWCVITVVNVIGYAANLAVLTVKSSIK